MPKLGIIEDTLFVPMLGRIYASEHCPQILYDQKALELKRSCHLVCWQALKVNTPCLHPPSDLPRWTAISARFYSVGRMV